MNGGILMANLKKVLKIAGCAALEIIILLADKFKGDSKDSKS